MPEARFKELFYSTSPRLKTPDDLCSVITLGLLGPEYMAGALYKGGAGAEAGRGTAGGRLKKRGKRSRKAKRKRKKRTLPLQLLSDHRPRGTTMCSSSAAFPGWIAQCTSKTSCNSSGTTWTSSTVPGL